MKNEETNRLRNLERTLYTTDIQPPGKRSVLHEEKIFADDDWQSDQEYTPRQTTMTPHGTPGSWFKKIFVTSLGFLGMALVILGVSFISGGNTISEKNVEVSVVAKSFVDGGEPLPVVVTITNNNKLRLELATLVLSYPEGDDAASPTARISRTINSLEAGDTHQESYSLQLYGTENSQKTITAHIEFRVSGSNAIYDTENIAQVTIRTSPITMTLVAPDKVLPNQEFPLTFTLVGNGTTTLSDTALIMEYPEGFTFTKGDPAPSFGNKVWYLGDVPPGVNRTITVYGTLSGSITDLKTIRASLGVQNKNKEDQLSTVYTSVAQVVPLSNAFLDASLVVANQTGPTVAINPNEQVRIRIPWKNTLTVPITNAEISVSFSGTAYDPARIEPISGFFDTANNRIVWTSREDTKLATISPGETGDITFSIRPRQSITNSSNPTIIASLNVLGYQSGGTRLSATAIDTKTLQINSDLNLLARTIHYTGAITNTGPMPPAANKETTYTLELKISNTRNRVSNAVVTTTLPTYVSWKNVVMPASENQNITYNEVTKQLVWNVGDVPAGTTGESKMVSVKIGITPSAQQRGGTPALTDQLVLTGRDTFTNKDLTISKLPLNTQLLNDGTGSGASGQVQ